ncbi:MULTISPECIES: hypothetical protein [Psychrilyobacter]|uniref:Uncharacterized protein n=1 Tax=Psychrilyobacter piezotolerans TaxID=2293438 RepID=A0ABX9KHE1_9FUSO|nr:MULTISPECIES: hypothetical protein [Psychrilyobacter]MCS5423003.1 hypothetical protein [Psychrilyobacter sp. S5]NDI77809.1 hypothetical protein [Psychrilyobacter piezotolerans]RDE62338.1 hypothetical protein DV867_07140 [Psychrilyobacter sp. S5]REI41436.1 hypothetical protein DYH56_07140 [Psychrilyobacter piezotolerans]
MMNKIVSGNLEYYLKCIKDNDGKNLYCIMETIFGKCGSYNDYDLNLYYDVLEEAEEKLKSM